VIQVEPLNTALPSKQEIYLPTCPLCAWNMPKITQSDAKLSEICEQNEWRFLLGNVIYDFGAQKFYKIV